MLIETAEGVLNTSHVVSAQILTGQGEEGYCRVTFADGTKSNVSVPMWAFERACGVVVPAQPGFMLVRTIPPFADEDGVLYIEETVIAFRVSSGGSYAGPMPIAAGGEPSMDVDAGPWVVVQPNGRCCGPDGEHDSLVHFKADCDRRFAKDREASRG